VKEEERAVQQKALEDQAKAKEEERAVQQKALDDQAWKVWLDEQARRSEERKERRSAKANVNWGKVASAYIEKQRLEVARSLKYREA
jgi:hypothetical protein